VTEPDPGSEIGDQKRRLLAELRRRRLRRERHEREGEPSFWDSVGTMGMVGWSVAVPTALGVLLGRWLDGRLGSGRVFMVFLMLVGLIVGCLAAWRSVSEKS